MAAPYARSTRDGATWSRVTSFVPGLRIVDLPLPVPVPVPVPVPDSDHWAEQPLHEAERHPPAYRSTTSRTLPAAQRTAQRERVTIVVQPSILPTKPFEERTTSGVAWRPAAQWSRAHPACGMQARMPAPQWSRPHPAGELLNLLVSPDMGSSSRDFLFAREQFRPMSRTRRHPCALPRQSGCPLHSPGHGIGPRSEDGRGRCRIPGTARGSRGVRCRATEEQLSSSWP